MKKIVFLLVNYNNTEETIRFVNKVLLLERKENIDICIENNSSKVEYDLLNQKFSSNKAVRIIHSPKNLGYLNGANYALEKLDKKDYEYYIVCNTDMDFPEKEFIETLLNFEIQGNTMIIAPKILKVDNMVNQNPYYKKKPSKKKFLFWKFAYRNDINFYIYIKINKLKKKLNNSLTLKSKNSREDNESIYAAHGSFMIIHKNFFDRNGTLEYPTFLYGEELFLANQIKNMNGCIIYKDDLLVIHNEHSTTNNINFSKNRLFIYQSIKFLYKDLNY